VAWGAGLGLASAHSGPSPDPPALTALSPKCLERLWIARRVWGIPRALQQEPQGRAPAYRDQARRPSRRQLSPAASEASRIRCCGFSTLHALTLVAIIEHDRSTPASIRRHFLGVWELEPHSGGGQSNPRNHLEHGQYTCARTLHTTAAHPSRCLVCAAGRCPPLQRSPFSGEYTAQMPARQPSGPLAQSDPHGLQIGSSSHHTPWHLVRMLRVFAVQAGPASLQKLTKVFRLGQPQSKAPCRQCSCSQHSPPADRVLPTSYVRPAYRFTYLDYDWALNKPREKPDGSLRRSRRLAKAGRVLSELPSERANRGLRHSARSKGSRHRSGVRLARC